MTLRKKVFVGSAVYLLLLWVLSSLPLAALVYDFGGIPLCKSNQSNLGWYLATYYGSLFIYPCVVGIFVLIALYLPLTTALMVGLKRERVLMLSGIFIIVTAALISFMEFYASPRAIFEIDPQVLRSNPEGQAFLAYLDPICDPNTKALAGKFDEYQQKIEQLVALGSSFSGAMYHVGVIAQALSFITLFTVFGLFIFFRKATLLRATTYFQSSIFFLLGCAIFYGSIWCLFRLTYRVDGNTLFGQHNTFYADYAIVFLYGIALLVFVLYFELELEKIAKKVSQVAQLLAFIFGIAIIQKGDASYIFGSRASLMNVLALFLLLVFLSVISLAFVIRTRPVLRLARRRRARKRARRAR